MFCSFNYAATADRAVVHGSIPPWAKSANLVGPADASDGLAYRLRRINQTLSLKATAGYDDVTGLGTPTAAILRLQ